MNSSQEGVTRAHFQTYETPPPPIISVQVKIICTDRAMIQSTGTRVVCDVPCSPDLLVNSAFFQVRTPEQVLTLQPLPWRKKGYLPFHPACEADESSSKLDHDPYGAVGGFRGNCKVFVSLKMAN